MHNNLRAKKGKGPLVNVVDKHGADWYWTEHDGELLVELYDCDQDVIGAVHKRPAGLFSGCLYKKVKDPGNASPNWTAIRPEALFDNLESAKEHVKALIAKRT